MTNKKLVEVKDLKKVAEKVQFQYQEIELKRDSMLKRILTKLIEKDIALDFEVEYHGLPENTIKNLVLQALTESTTPLLQKIEELETWKADQQQFLIKLATRLVLLGAKNDNMIESVEEIGKGNLKLQSQIAVMREALKIGIDCLKNSPSFDFRENTQRILDKALTTDGSELGDKQYENSLKFFGWNPKKETADIFLSGLNGEIETLKQQLSTSLELLVKAKEDFKTSLNTIVKLNNGCFPLPYPESEVWKHNTCKGLNETLTQIETFLKENKH